MNLRSFLDDARLKGEGIKDQILSELMQSEVLKDLLKSDLFAKAITTVLRTKDEVALVLRNNVKHALRIMDVPTQHELNSLERKVDQMEKSIDRAAKKAITVRSLKKIQKRKNSSRRYASKKR